MTRDECLTNDAAEALVRRNTRDFRAAAESWAKAHNVTVHSATQTLLSRIDALTGGSRFDGAR